MRTFEDIYIVIVRRKCRMCIKFGNMFFSFIQFVEVFSIFSKKKLGIWGHNHDVTFKKRNVVSVFKVVNYHMYSHNNHRCTYDILPCNQIQSSVTHSYNSCTKVVHTTFYPLLMFSN